MISNYEYRKLTEVELLGLAHLVLNTFNELNISPFDVLKVLDIIRYVNEISKIEKQ